jgi:hypothetical protein
LLKTCNAESNRVTWINRSFEVSSHEDPKRRRRFALPAHSKLPLPVLTPADYCSVLARSDCERRSLLEKEAPEEDDTQDDEDGDDDDLY